MKIFVGPGFPAWPEAPLAVRPDWKAWPHENRRDGAVAPLAVVRNHHSRDTHGVQQLASFFARIRQAEKHPDGLGVAIRMEVNGYNCMEK
jgi:hypothetical protein